MNRKRLARLVAVGGVALVAAHLASTLPREVEIRYALGPDHRQITEARIGYVSEDRELKGVLRRFEHGAPESFRERVELPPGSYEVVADLRGPGLARTATRRLEVPAEGLVRIELTSR